MSDSVSMSKGGDDDFSGTEVIIVEGFAKFRDVKRVRLESNCFFPTLKH